MINLKNYELERLENNAYTACFGEKVLICVLGGVSRVKEGETRVRELVRE